MRRPYPYYILILLALAIAAYAVLVYGLMPIGKVVHPDMRANFEAHATIVYTHIFASSIALAVGVLQFSKTLRVRHIQWHRWLGRIYLAFGVIPGGLAGLLMAFHAYGGLVSQLGFGVLALLWLFSGVSAYRAIRRGDIKAHQEWMIGNYALTCAAISLRLYLPLSMVAGIPFELAYPAIAWLCWVPNLIYARWMITQNRSRNANEAKET
ncbi:DUF2306 domain-containing protein [Undibacterium cyanobacteriorum]|uniref:DUF2306 domain-containing protein n=1 Tax=Undibacterium cyanobacteriorum TaxID=3073561 RepID=A0ABY9RH62_9BURK|nr:DUF2306 domain-containing protein [Undibacterium sp. 20NA77.5]WMW80558.1 DUF2306 domain-containing protein [Undibacterium sp. 20NA77.5]